VLASNRLRLHRVHRNRGFFSLAEMVAPVPLNKTIATGAAGNRLLAIQNAIRKPP